VNASPLSARSARLRGGAASHPTVQSSRRQKSLAIVATERPSSTWYARKRRTGSTTTSARQTVRSSSSLVSEELGPRRAHAFGLTLTASGLLIGKPVPPLPHQHRAQVVASQKVQEQGVRVSTRSTC